MAVTSVSSPVLLSADRRCVGALARWNEAHGDYRPDLVTWESQDEVALAWRENKGPLPGNALPLAEISARMVTTTLPRPLGGRRLVDAATRRELDYYDGRHLAEITWLPADYDFEGDEIPFGLPGHGAEPLSFAWDRTYVEKGTGAHRRLVITQVSSPAPHGFGAGMPVVDRADVGGRHVSIRERGNLFTNGIDHRAVTWSTRAYSYTVDSKAQVQVDWDPEHPLDAPFHEATPEEQALSTDTLLRVVDGLREP